MCSMCSFTLTQTPEGFCVLQLSVPVLTSAVRTCAACANLCSSYLCKPVLPIPVLTLAACPYANGCCPYLCKHTLACMGCSKLWENNVGFKKKKNGSENKYKKQVQHPREKDLFLLCGNRELWPLIRGSVGSLGWIPSTPPPPPPNGPQH